MPSITNPARIAALTALVLIASAESCDFDAPPRYGLDVRLADGPLVTSFETGDEATFVAIETDIEATGIVPNSRLAPANYGWASSDTTVATMSSEGLLRARAIGGTTITVRSLHATSALRVFVGPKFGRIQLRPDTATIAVGESAAFRILAFDPAGNPIDPDSSRGYLRLMLVPSPAARPPAPLSPDQWTVTGVAPGTAMVIARVDALNGFRLRDTSIVVVR